MCFCTWPWQGYPALLWAPRAAPAQQEAHTALGRHSIPALHHRSLTTGELLRDAAQRCLTLFAIPRPGCITKQLRLESSALPQLCLQDLVIYLSSKPLSDEGGEEKDSIIALIFFILEVSYLFNLKIWRNKSAPSCKAPHCMHHESGTLL